MPRGVSSCNCGSCCLIHKLTYYYLRWQSSIIGKKKGSRWQVNLFRVHMAEKNAFKGKRPIGIHRMKGWQIKFHAPCQELQALQEISKCGSSNWWVFEIGGFAQVVIYSTLPFLVRFPWMGPAMKNHEKSTWNALNLHISSSLTEGTPKKDRRALLDHFFGYLRVKLHRLQPEQPAFKNTAPGPGATGTAAWSLCRDITNQ